jgi:hypothetical protein
MPKGFVWITLTGNGHYDMQVLVSETAVTAEGRGAENIHNFIYNITCSL